MGKKRGGSLLEYVIKRILLFIPVILFISIINFGLIRIAPGDPVNMILGDEPASPEIVERIRSQLGLDRPLHEQLFIYLSNLIRGDLGYSYGYRQPVTQIILGKLPNTLLLAFTSLIIAFSLGIILGVFLAMKPNSLISKIILNLVTLSRAIPIFWLGFILILFFSIYLDWFPIGGMMSYGPITNYYLDRLKHLFLPALSLGLFELTLATRITRTQLLEQLGQNYVVMARSKGLSKRAIVYKHVLKNVMLPLVTVIGFRLGYVASGSVLIETIFSWPGVGRLLVDATRSLDYPIVLGVLVIISFTVTLMTLITDILYAILDPRVRL